MKDLLRPAPKGIDQAWEDYEHLNYAEEPDMDHVERAFKEGYRQALWDAADRIQAMHPGEVKASVECLRQWATE